MKSFIKFLLIVDLLAIGINYLINSNIKFKNQINKLLYTLIKGKEPKILKKESSSIKFKVINFKKANTLKADEFYAIDVYARNTPKLYEKDLNTLALYLIKPALNETEKVRSIFTWVATHIKYDDMAFNTKKYSDYSATNVLKSKKAVCEGYSNLFAALCLEANIESEKIIGFSKGYSYNRKKKFKDTNHAWNAAKIDNQWRLFDVTWASGYGTTINEKLVSTRKFNAYWFYVNPKEFIFTHLPENNQWQLTNNLITLQQFATLPNLNESFFQNKFNSDSVFNNALNEQVKEFVDTYPIPFPFKAVDAPYFKNLDKNKTINMSFESEYFDSLVLKDGKSWHNFLKYGNLFSISHLPLNNDIEILVKINSFDKSFSTLLHYSVIKKNGRNI